MASIRLIHSGSVRVRTEALQEWPLHDVLKNNAVAMLGRVL